MRWGIIALCFWLPWANAGKVYTCKDGAGRTLYSQTPCPSAYSETEQRLYEPSSAIQGGASTEDLKRMADDVANNNQRIKLERDKRNAERRLEKLRSEREAMVNEQAELALSLGGTNAKNRGQAIIDSMKDKNADYERKIQAERERVKNANERLKELDKTPESEPASAAR